MCSGTLPQTEKERLIKRGRNGERAEPEAITELREKEENRLAKAERNRGGGKREKL